MSFFVTRSGAPADVFARGDTAVLVIGSEAALNRVREAVIGDRDLSALSDPDGAIVTLSPDAMVYAPGPDAEAWLLLDVPTVLAPGRHPPLATRLVLVAGAVPDASMRDAKLGRVAEELIAAGASAVLVAER